jgi:phosphatidylserine decarboxylase
MWHYALFLIPKNWLSRLTGIIVRARFPFKLHTLLKNAFTKIYDINTDEASEPFSSYTTLGDFFIRKLKPGARPLACSHCISPVDGAITQFGSFTGSACNLEQVKGQNYSLSSFLTDQWSVGDFEGGGYLTFYLKPHNYHWVHCPVDSSIIKVVHVPGSLWPVDTWSVSHIEGLFVRNERVLIELNTSYGVLIAALVGATNVGKISLSFCNEIKGNTGNSQGIRCWQPKAPIPLNKGDELGCFEMGSTVILIGAKSLMENIKKDWHIPHIINMGAGISF